MEILKEYTAAWNLKYSVKSANEIDLLPRISHGIIDNLIPLHNLHSQLSTVAISSAFQLINLPPVTNVFQALIMM